MPSGLGREEGVGVGETEGHLFKGGQLQSQCQINSSHLDTS